MFDRRRHRHHATFRMLLFLNLQKTPPSKEKTETSATSASTDTLKDPARVIKDRPVNATLRKEQAVMAAVLGFANPL